MAIGVPIQVEGMTKSSLSFLVDLRWRDEGSTSDFIIPGDERHAFRVQFDRVEIVRILDEMPLCTEDQETPNEGLVRDGFAYLVEGALF